jgi:hypothetical protein
VGVLFHGLENENNKKNIITEFGSVIAKYLLTRIFPNSCFMLMLIYFSHPKKCLYEGRAGVVSIIRRFIYFLFSLNSDHIHRLYYIIAKPSAQAKAPLHRSIKQQQQKKKLKKKPRRPGAQIEEDHIPPIYTSYKGKDND